MDRRRAGRNHRSVPARAAAISTKTKLFMATTLTRCSGKTEDNSRAMRSRTFGATARLIPTFWPGLDHAFA